MPTNPSTLFMHSSHRGQVINLETHRPVVMLRDDDTRVSEMYATADAINAGIRMVEQRDSIAACTSDRCSSGDRKCPTPDACRLPEPAPLAWLTPRRFWWGYAITLAVALFSAHVLSR